MVKICPSLLNADFFKLRETLDVLKDLGIRCLHLDIMDGHFVPEISFGPRIIELIKGQYDFYLDTHLMLSNPEQVLPRYIDAGSDAVSVHIETGGHLDRMLRLIKERGLTAGLAFNPATAINLEIGVWELVDRVILMSVNPGFGGQKFIGYTLNKLQNLSNFLRVQGFNTEICVDGGVSDENICSLAKAGATDVVIGSYLFRGQSIKQQMQKLQEQLSKFS